MTAAALPTTDAAPTGAMPARSMLWLLPGGLTLVFVAMFAGWAQHNDAAERNAHQRTLAADADSVEAQLAGRRDMELARLREVAARLPARPDAAPAGAQAALREAMAVPDRLWNRLVWIDADKRIVAVATRPASARPAIAASEGLRIRDRGQADHLATPLTEAGGRAAGDLLARYDITDLLQGTDLGWLNHRYEVSFLSELGEVIATTAGPLRRPEGEAFERVLTASKDTRVRLVPYAAPQAWTDNPRMLALLAGLLALGGAASLLLRRESRSTARAVTRWRTEAAWRQAMEDSALVGLRARDAQGRLLYVNKTLCEMVGYSAAELVGLAPPLPFWPPEAIDAMMARNLNTLAGGAPATGYETRWRHRNGRTLDVVIFESRLVDARGRHVGWMGSIVDISERKRLEEQDRRHTEALAQHARLNDMGLLASELAHELNQPLTALVGYSAGLALAMKRKAASDPDTLEAVEALHRHARKAGDIVNWIRRQTSRSAPQRRPEDINAIVADVLSAQGGALRRARASLAQALAPGLPPAPVDRVGIEQVITNLVRNAADALAAQEAPAHPDAGARPQAPATARVITVRTEAVPGELGECAALAVTVTDNGPGLQGRSIDALCSTFFSTRREGMGLGLGICRSIVELHGGTLGAHDAPGGGACFRFTLPIHPTAPPLHEHQHAHYLPV